MPRTYNEPTYNVWAAVYLPGVVKTDPPSYFTLAQLRHTLLNPLFPNAAGVNPLSNTPWHYILVPRGTDIRRATGVTSSSNDYVLATRFKLPFDQERWYYVHSLEDRAAGFSNEHRCCFVMRYAPDPVPMPPIYTGAPIIEPITVSCASRTVMARRYRAIIDGISGSCVWGASLCDDGNGSWVMEHVAGCTWRKTDYTSCVNGGVEWLTLLWNAGVSMWELTTGGWVYRCADVDFDPFGPSLFTFHSSTGLCTMPATITVEPA